jgi:hypothetical protein
MYYVGVQEAMPAPDDTGYEGDGYHYLIPGTSFNQESAVKVFCTRCGAKNRDGAMFCTTCGAGLTGVQETSPAEQTNQVSSDTKPDYRLILIGLPVAVFVFVIIVTQVPYAQVAALEDMLTVTLGVFVAAGIVLLILGGILGRKKE